MRKKTTELKLWFGFDRRSFCMENGKCVCCGLLMNDTNTRVNYKIKFLMLHEEF
jgi:hypothetical protein